MKIIATVHKLLFFQTTDPIPYILSSYESMMLAMHHARDVSLYLKAVEPYHV